MSEAWNEGQVKNYMAISGQGQAVGVQTLMYNPTVRENIDNRIRGMQTEVERLQTVRVKLEKSGLLDVPIRDLQEAMRF